MILSMLGQIRAQVAINTDGTVPNSSAMLDVKSTARGLLIPRMTKAHRDAIGSPANGLLVFQTDNTPGFYYNSGTTGAPVWIMVGDGGLTLPYSGTASSGSVAFDVTSSVGWAISGTSTVSSGILTGVYGESSSSEGRGVWGNANSTTGSGVGVYGYSEAPAGYGIFGWAAHTTGNTYGVYGFNNSSSGTGVAGVDNALTGGTYGVYGSSMSSSGCGVKGIAFSTSGTTYGVYGRSSSPDGTGVYGTAEGSSGTTYGVRGSTGSLSGFGVYGSGPYIGIKGEAIGTMDVNFGVYGESESLNGRALYGIATATEGYAYGVQGVSLSGTGIGVFGHASSTTGENIGIYGNSNSPDGYSGYFLGAKFHVNGYVGIGTVSPECAMVIQAPDNQSRNMLLIKNGDGNNRVQMRQNSNGSGGIWLYNGADENTVFLYGEGSSFINSGNLGIGTSSPTQVLDVNGNGRFRSVGSGAYAGPLNRTSDGTLTTASSDIRLKENIQSLQNSLDKVMQLRGVSFTWKADPEMGTRIGFVAQEFEQVVPELVFTNETDGYKGINYAEVTALLAEAFKELKAENDRLKDVNDKQEARLDKLEALIGLRAEK